MSLRAGQTMTYPDDLEENWGGKVTLERIDPCGAVKKPSVPERRGKTPELYPRWED